MYYRLREPSQLEKQNSHFILCLKAGLKRCPWRIIEKIFATKTVQLYILSVVMIKPEILTHHCNRTNHKMSITVAFSCWKRKEKKHKVRDKKVRDGMTVLNIINWLQKNTYEMMTSRFVWMIVNVSMLFKFMTICFSCHA